MPKLDAADDLNAAKTGASMVDVKPARLSREAPGPEQFHQSEHRLHVLGIDPGGKEEVAGEGGHMGLTLAAIDRALPNGFKVQHSWEMKPAEFVPWFTIVTGMGLIDQVVLERFKLLKEFALSLVGSEFETVQMIGWITITVNQLSKQPEEDMSGIEGRLSSGIGLARQLPSERFGPYPALMRKAGMGYVSPLSPDHARSSEDHLISWAFRNGIILDVNGKPFEIR